MVKTIKKETMWRDETGKFYYGWWIVLMTGVLCMFSYCGIIALTGIFTIPVSETLGITIGQFSLHATILSVTSMIVLAVCTRLFTKKYLKKTILAAIVAGCIGFAGFATAQAIGQIYIFAVALGICFALATMTPCQILIGNWFGEKYRAKAMSIWLSLITIGPAIMIPIVNAVVLNMGWRIAYLGIGAGLALCFPVVIFAVKFSPEEKGLKRIGELSEDEKAAAAVRTQMSEGIMFKDAKKHIKTWIVLVTTPLFTIGSGAYLSHSMPTMVLSGYTSTFASALASAMLIGMVILCIVAGAVIDRFGIFIGTIITGVCFVICYIGLAVMNFNPVLGLVLSIIGYPVGVLQVNLISPLLLTHVFGEKDIAAYLGCHNILLSLGVAVGPGVVGALFDATGDYTVPWIAAGCLTAIGVIIRSMAAGKKGEYKQSSEV